MTTIGRISMSTAVDRFTEAARELDVDVNVEQFPEGTRTADDAARAIGCDVAQIVKSLVFVADSRPVLVLTSGANRVDTGRVSTLLHAEHVRKADADEVREATGFAIGGTPPFGHPERLTTLVDPALLDYDTVHAAAGTPMDNFAITPSELVRASGGVVVDFTE